jgi:hypothetical protein
MKSKPSSCLTSLKQELNILRALDDKNQTLFATSVEQKSKNGITKAQMHLLTEAIFFAAFKTYEQFLRNVFLIYCCGIQPSKRKLVRSYLKPRSIQHAELLIQSSMPFLDWSSPDTLIERSETYLEDGYPIKMPITTNLNSLKALKKIRNHIAHMSKESLEDFKKVVKDHYGTLPLRIPRPGEFLLLTSQRARRNYYLREYIQLIENVAISMT